MGGTSPPDGPQHQGGKPGLWGKAPTSSSSTSFKHLLDIHVVFHTRDNAPSSRGVPSTAMVSLAQPWCPRHSRGVPGTAAVLAQLRFPHGSTTGAQWTDAQSAAVLAPL